MRKLYLGFAALLLGSSLTYGNAADEILHNPALEPTEQVAVTSAEDSGLTPKRSSAAVIRAQQSTPLAPMAPFVTYNTPTPRLAEATRAVEAEPPATPEPVNTSLESYAYIFAELEHLNSEIQKIKKDTAKPDPKKSFSTPKLAGRLFFDSFAIDEGKNTPDYENRAGLRELRFTVTGTGYEVFDYKAEFTLASTGGVDMMDSWIGAKNVPLLGYFRAGHYNIENGLSFMSGTNHYTLTGFHPSTYSFNLGRKCGVSSEHLFARDRIRWIYGVYQGQNTNVNHSVWSDNQGLILNTRLTAAPYYAEGGRYLLHIGGHYSYIDGVTSNNNIDAYLGGTNWLSRTLRAANPADQHHHRSGAEIAYQRGPFGARAESFVAAYTQGTATGTTAEVCYFLTGEHRAYNLATATIGAAQVKRPFRPFKYGDWNLVDGLGAWQLVGRYAYTDLGDWRGAANSTGGYQHDLTFGVNWFWTSNIRCIFEYTHSQWDEGLILAHRSANIFGTSIRVFW